MQAQTALTRTLGIEVPLICGAMYPCSNPELVAAVSEAGGIGIVQPLSLTYVYGHDFREGLRYIRSLTRKPIGVNLIVEQSSRKYLARVQQWLDIALEEQIPFLVTANYDEIIGYQEVDDQVFSLPIPPEIYQWLERYVVNNYIPPQPRKRKRVKWSQENEQKPPPARRH